MEGSKGGGGEVRRINVVYFLSRNGNAEHPHLLRVQHLHRNGVHLRDVKRWLSELRGKDMAESFAWSYKRRYKSGYVWQDLMDDDLITPISDNEYILKGSDLFPKLDDHSLPLGPFSLDGHLQAAAEEEAKESPPETLQLEPDETLSPKPPPRLDQESPVSPPQPPSSSDASDESAKRRTEVLKNDMMNQQEEKKKMGEEGKENQQDHHARSTGGRAPRGFRNLLGCAAVATKDSAVLPVKRHEKDGLISGGRDLSIGGSHRRRSFAGGRANPRYHPSTDPKGSRKSWSGGGRSWRKTREMPIPPAYKPVAQPNCSQCGKAFKPEKLHSHMKSCKTLRAGVKSDGSLERQPLKTVI